MSTYLCLLKKQLFLLKTVLKKVDSLSLPCIQGPRRDPSRGPVQGSEGGVTHPLTVGERCEKGDEWVTHTTLAYLPCIPLWPPECRHSLHSRPTTARCMRVRCLDATHDALHCTCTPASHTHSTCLSLHPEGMREA